MPKAKPISLHLLTFHEALKHLVRIDPDSVGITSERRKKRKRKSKSKHTTNRDSAAASRKPDTSG
jgi:hypothetical protein